MAIVTHLIVEERGAFISKHQGRLWVKKGKDVLQQAPLIHLEQVIVRGRAISFSADAVAACAEQGIPIHFISFKGTPYASLYSAGLTGTVQTRRAQLSAYQDRRGVCLYTVPDQRSSTAMEHMNLTTTSAYRELNSSDNVRDLS